MFRAVNYPPHLNNGAKWCGVVWCGVVWCGVVWWRVNKALSLYSL